MDPSDEQQASGSKRASDAAAAASDEPSAKRGKAVPVAGTSPAGAAAATNAASDPTAVIAPSLSVAQRCDQDSLSVVFSFCQGISHAVAAAQTCRSWYAATTLRQSSCRARVWLDRNTFHAMLESPLRGHLSRLRIRGTATTGNDLLQLSARCPQVEQLAVLVDAVNQRTDGFRWPRRCA
jgi:hypothetical protein